MCSADSLHMEFESGHQETRNHKCESEHEDDSLDDSILEICCSTRKTIPVSLQSTILTFQQERQLGCLFRIHEKFSVDLEDEPRNVDIRKLIGFKINAVDARKSILGFTDILRSRDHGYVNSGEENNDPTIQDQPDEDVQQQIPDNTPIDHEAPNTDVTRVRDMDGRERNLSLDSILLHSAESMPPLNSNECGPDHQPQAQAPPSSYTDQPSLSGMEQQSYDVWPPFFHPTMLDVLPDSEMLNLPQVDLSSVDLDYLEPENWFLSTNSIP